MAETIEQSLRDLPEQARDGRWETRIRTRLGRPPLVPPRLDGTLAEYRAFVDGLTEIRDDPPAPPRVPTVVLSAADEGSRADLRAAHARYVGSLPSGRHREVTDSGHDVHLRRPDLVAEEIRALL